MISIVASNLLSNALKYCNTNGIISLSITEVKKSILVQISNSGESIPKEDMDKVFTPFFRSNSVKSSEIKGMGLGLSIVKRLCDLLEINIEMDSETNQNTTVKLTFK